MVEELKVVEDKLFETKNNLYIKKFIEEKFDLSDEAVNEYFTQYWK